MKHFALALFLILLAICGSGQTRQDTRPNIIYIMADDMGYADLSCYGRKDYQTPVLDSFAKQGMKFSQAYAAAPVCTPSRVAFMTGRYPARNPIGLREPLLMDSTDIDIGLSQQTPTVSSLLKKSGYHTALFGKWHLGFKPEFFPAAHGFDYFFGISPGGADYVNHTYEGKEVLFENNKPIRKKGYLTDLITDRAIDYIAKTKGPFFISLQYNSPHWPWQAPGDPAYANNVGLKGGGSRETYGKMVQSLDSNIGRVLKALKDSGKENNTLVIFTSDNGGEKYSDMGPLRGMKLELWEGGIRVPAMVRWPGKIRSGSQTDQVAVTMDWTVTILSAAQVKWGDEPKFDGIDLVPVLKGQPSIGPRDLFWRLSNRGLVCAYRSGDWKYLKVRNEEFLFDLKNDLGEQTDLKEKNPAEFQKLKTLFETRNDEMLPPYFFRVKK